jgi:hypothetical protein
VTQRLQQPRSQHLLTCCRACRLSFLALAARLVCSLCDFCPPYGRLVCMTHHGWMIETDRLTRSVRRLGERPCQMAHTESQLARSYADVRIHGAANRALPLLTVLVGIDISWRSLLDQRRTRRSGTVCKNDALEGTERGVSAHPRHTNRAVGRQSADRPPAAAVGGSGTSFDHSAVPPVRRVLQLRSHPLLCLVVRTAGSCVGGVRTNWHGEERATGWSARSNSNCHDCASVGELAGHQERKGSEKQSRQAIV